ncbi:MAG: hypothetical protein IKG81_01515 [Bacteroidales bacterium]|nr:hypothetical protein [Bacteroidales bacterium]
MELKRIAPIVALAALAMLLATSCEKVTITEGIYGRVKVRYGDWMPGSTNGGEKPLACEVRAYEYFTLDDIGGYRHADYSPEQISKTLVASTNSDSKGRYQLSLPPGQYSVVLMDGDMCQITSVDDKGGICPVTVTADKTTECNLILDCAVY